MLNRWLLAVVGLLFMLVLLVSKWYASGFASDAPVISLDENGRKISDVTWPNLADGIAKSRDKPAQPSVMRPLPENVLMDHPVPQHTALIPTHPETQSARQLWRVWKKLLKNSQHQQLPIIGAFLAKKLRQHPDNRLYDEMKILLAEPAFATANKAMLLDLLAETASPEAMEVVLGQALAEADAGQSPTSYLLVLLAISHMGDNRWGGEFHEELSPALEQAWSNPETQDPRLVTTLASTIAKIGAPKGVDLLLQTLSGDDNANVKSETGRLKQEAAFLAIPQTRNPNAVAVLGDSFQHEPLESPVLEASGDALAAIGSPEATRKIVDWAKQAPAEGARNLDAWLTTLDENSALPTMVEAQTATFQSLEVGAVVKKFTSTAAR